MSLEYWTYRAYDGYIELQSTILKTISIVAPSLPSRHATVTDKCPSWGAHVYCRYAQWKNGNISYCRDCWPDKLRPALNADSLGAQAKEQSRVSET